MRRNGFSLTELLVAVFILAAGSVEVGRLFHNNARLIEAETEMAQLVDIAEGLLARAILDPEMDAGSQASGSEGAWIWLVEGELYKPFEEEKEETQPSGRKLIPPHRLVELTVTVSNRETERQFQLSGLATRSGLSLTGAP